MCRGGVSYVMLSIGSGVSGVSGASDNSSKGCILQGSGVLGIGIMCVNSTLQIDTCDNLFPH